MPGLTVAQVRIENFRVLRSAMVPLRHLTVLIGENNAGKTSFLDAIGTALGEPASADDLFVEKGGKRVDEFVVDVLIKPNEGDEFDESIEGIVGDALQIPMAGPQFFAIRARGSQDSDRGGIAIRRAFIKGWDSDEKILRGLPDLKRPSVGRDLLDAISFHSITAKRDIVEQLRARTSHWGRLAGNLDINKDLVVEIEKGLAALGEKIVKGSVILEQVRKELDQITSALSKGDQGVSVAPLPGRIDDLVRGMDVLLQVADSASLPIGRQGMGTRSLAAIMVFVAFVKMRSGKGAGVPMSVVALEEPEAHLHPQAQRTVFNLVSSIPGQRLVSTHSPFISSVADIFDFRVFRREGAGASISWIPEKKPNGSDALSPEQKEMARRFVQRRHGEALFSRLVVLFEGDSEEAAIPVFADAAWGEGGADKLGVSFINVAGAQSYKHYLPILEQLKIPWLIFSDGDDAGIKGVDAAGKDIGATLDEKEARVVMLPTAAKGQDFEANLVSEGLRGPIEKAVAACYGPDELANFRAALDGTKLSGGGVRDYKSAGWENRVAQDFIYKHKGILGRFIAKEILAPVAGGGKPKVPAKVVDLFERASKILKTKSNL